MGIHAGRNGKPLIPQNSKQMPTSYHIFFFLCLFTCLSFSYGTELIIVNKCMESIWPAILGTTGHETPNNGGFHLCSGEQSVIQVPENWSGRIWGSQGCCFDETGKGSCQTGDCTGLLSC